MGNNGGGFLNANSSHPFENPTPLTNWLEMFAILMFPFALTYAFGRYADSQRQGWTIVAAMTAILVVGAVVAMNHEYVGNPLFPAGVDQAGVGNMEGKEVRFGAALGGLFAAVTTGTSTGAINAWHDSLQPIAGLVPLFNMELGEITPGGIGAGMYGMLVIGAILAVFIAGLMVGRTPEYLGKKVEAFEIKMAMLVALVLGASILGFTALASVLPEGTAGPLNPGPHGFSEILYAFSSQTGNNGSAFGGLTGNTPFYNITGGLAMLIGRYGMIVPILALAGSMAAKRRVAPSLGTFPTTGILWVVLLIGVVDHRRRAHVLPGARAGPDRRAAPPERRKGLLMALMSVDLGRGTRRFQRFVTLGGAKPSGEPPRPRGILDPDLLRSAIPHAFRKLDPRLLIKNPVMFVVEITAVLVTLIAIADVTGVAPADDGAGASGSRSRSAVWLWFTVLFATYAEAVAEARGRAQAATLRKTRSETTAHRRLADGTLEDVGSSELRKGDIIVVEEGETIAGDGDVIEGIGFVNEAAITGESAPVLKEPGTDIRSSVTGGTTLVSDRIVVRGHDRPGRDVPGPDDRPRRGREAPADAQRDRSRDPAGRPLGRLPDGHRHATAVRRLRGHDPSRRWRSSPCWCASSRRRSAGCCRPSASPAWTGSPGSTCSR